MTDATQYNGSTPLPVGFTDHDVHLRTIHAIVTELDIAREAEAAGRAARDAEVAFLRERVDSMATTLAGLYAESLRAAAHAEGPPRDWRTARVMAALADLSKTAMELARAEIDARGDEMSDEDFRAYATGYANADKEVGDALDAACGPVAPPTPNTDVTSGSAGVGDAPPVAKVTAEAHTCDWCSVATRGLYAVAFNLTNSAEYLVKGQESIDRLARKAGECRRVLTALQPQLDAHFAALGATEPTNG